MAIYKTKNKISLKTDTGIQVRKAGELIELDEKTASLYPASLEQFEVKEPVKPSIKDQGSKKSNAKKLGDE